MPVDIMSKMRGVDGFSALWKRRTSIAFPNGTRCHALSLPDLVQAKKTQRDKDWPMIRRLLKVHYFENSKRPTRAHVEFWLRELRTPQLLVEVASEHPRVCGRLLSKRPLLNFARTGSLTELQRALQTEEATEREIDQRYWLPLRQELERLRSAHRAVRHGGTLDHGKRDS